MWWFWWTSALIYVAQYLYEMIRVAIVLLHVNLLHTAQCSQMSYVVIWNGILLSLGQINTICRKFSGTEAQVLD